MTDKQTNRLKYHSQNDNLPKFAIDVGLDIEDIFYKRSIHKKLIAVAVYYFKKSPFKK